MILQNEVELAITIIFYVLLFSLAVYVAGAVCKRDTGKQGYGTAFFLSLIFILAMYFLIVPYLWPYISQGWIQLIVIFLLIFVLFLIFYTISGGGALLAAIICLVVLWVLEFVVNWLFGLFGTSPPTLIHLFI